MVVVEITLGVPIWFEDTMLAFLTSPNWPCVCWQQRKRYQPLTILTSDCQGFLKDKINFLFHPCEEQKNKLKQQKHREEREIRAIYPTKNILQIQVFRWYEKLIRNLAQIQSWRFLCTGRGWTLIKGKKKTLFYSLELSASINSADYFIIMMVLFTNFFYMFLTIIMTQSFENKYTVCIWAQWLTQ